jgi:peptide/nickel transport system substrate-binding protein
MAIRAAAGGSLLPPAMPGHMRLVRPAATIEEAAALLADAGYPDGAGLPPVRLAAPASMRQLTEGVEEWLARIGLTADVSWIPAGTSVSALECDAWISGWVADYPDPHGFFRGLLSRRHVDVLADDRVTGLLERLQACRDRDERLSLYAALDRHLVERALIVPLSYSRSVMLHRPWVRDLWSNALSDVRFDQASVER